MSEAWDGYPPAPDRPGYHWLQRTDAGIPTPAVIWTWRPEVQAWRWKGEAQMSPAEQAATNAYIAPVTDHAEVDRLRAERDEARAEVERLREEVAAREAAARREGIEAASALRSNAEALCQDIEGLARRFRALLEHGR